MDFKYVDLTYILEALLQGKCVEIETVGPYMLNHFDSTTGEFVFNIANFTADEMIGLKMASVLRKLRIVFPTLRLVSLIDDVHGPNNTVVFRCDRYRYYRFISRLYREQGAILPQDKRNIDYILLRENRLKRRVDKLEARLAKSSAGVLERVDDSVVFRPSDKTMESSGIKSKSTRKKLLKDGILLRRSGTPTCQAMDAAGFIKTRNANIVHLVALDTSFERQQDEVFTLVSSMGNTDSRNYHNILFDSKILDPRIATYMFLKAISMSLNEIIRRLQ